MSETFQADIHGHTVVVALQSGFDRAFWTRWLPNGWEADTFEFVREAVTPGTVFLDIGAWIGPISLYAAALGARVIALDPDPVSYASLSANVRLNPDLPGSIEPLHTAFNATPGSIRIFGNHKGFGTSGSSSIGVSHRWITVPATTPDDLIARVGAARPVVMKVDVEAHEYFCAEALSRLRTMLGATMHMSIHPFLLRKSMRWHRLMGTADAEMIRRTREMLGVFSDAELVAAHRPDLTALQAVDELLTPTEGDGTEFAVIARPR